MIRHQPLDESSRSVSSLSLRPVYVSVAQLVAQLVASMSGVVLGGVVEVVGSNLARGKIFTASIDSVDSLYPSVYTEIQKSNDRKRI